MTRVVSKATVIVAAVLGGTAYGLSGCSSTEGAQPRGPEVGEYATATELTPGAVEPSSEEEVGRFAEEMGVDRDVARALLAAEDAALGIERRLAEQHPESFAGLWVNDGGTPGLTVAFTGKARTFRGDVEQLYGGPGLVHLRSVDHSLAELAAVQQQMVADRDIVRRAGAGQSLSASEQERTSVLGGGVAETRGEYGLDIDVFTNALVVGVSEPSPTLLDDLRAAYPSVRITLRFERPGPG